ncbi:MAG: hypothetical protein WC544_00740 [Patescibacteria group bacterium]
MGKNIIISDQTSLDNKIKDMRRDGPGGLHVLSDFDRTLTKAYVNGKKIWSLLAILRDHFMLTPDYPAKAQALADTYLSLERDPRISRQEKKKLMNEWWTKHFTLLVACGLTKSDIVRALSIGQIELRPGTDTMFSLLNGYHIPLVIMSASGIGGDAIAMYLKKQGLLSPNTHVIGNTIIWDKSGRATGVKKPIIHSLNKDETVIQQFPAYADVRDRKNVILLGDFTDDVEMVTGFDYTNLISIGFLNEDTDRLLPEYKKCYDVVILNDGPMDAINNIIKSVIQ